MRAGILAWNMAFEAVGIVAAIGVRQQDAQGGAYPDIAPVETRYSFVRWTNSHMDFAIGPVHVRSDTGGIGEADIVRVEGFILSYAYEHQDKELAVAEGRRLDPSELREVSPTMLPQVWQPQEDSVAAGQWSCMVQPGLSTSVATARWVSRGAHSGCASDTNVVLEGLRRSRVFDQLSS